MKLKWRNKEYEFTPRTLTAGRDSVRNTDLNNLIFGFDTESVLLPDRYIPICFQIADPDGTSYIEYLHDDDSALEKFLEFFVSQFDKDVSRETNIFVYCHNLVYDWGQLIKKHPDLIAIAKTGIGLNENIELPILIDGHTVTLKKGGLFKGSAPHFSLILQISSRKKCTLHFRDTFAFFPGSLGNITEQLGLTPKLPRPDGIGKVDYRQLPKNDPTRLAFEAYALVDPEATRQTAEKIRELHRQADMKRLRVSAPSFAINKMLHVIDEEVALANGSSDKTIMQLVIDCYAGGRTGGIYHGVVSDLMVLDIHSSYPASMVTLPSFSPEMDYFRYPNPESLTECDLLEIIKDVHCFMRVSGEEMDEKYPALITNKKKKLCPVFGAFENLATTGVEVCSGIMSGSLKISVVHEIVLLLDHSDDSYLPFKVFIENAYSRKENAEKDSTDYTSAKLEMNAGYGKLIESRDETSVDETVRNTIVPFTLGDEKTYSEFWYKIYIECIQNETDFWDTLNTLLPQIAEELGDDMVVTMFGDLSLTKLEYGRYVIPAAAALITATSRARLRTAMVALESLYWDTDSIFRPHLSEKEIHEALSVVADWLPKFIQPVTYGDKLGELGKEIDHARGYLAGVKRYYLTDEINEKKAIHGIPTAPKDEAEWMLRELATGRAIRYRGKERPLTVNEAETPNEIGQFKSKEYESKFNLDTRLDWERVEDGWIGSVKPIAQI